MKIKIVTENSAKIENALMLVNGHASGHTLTTYNLIDSIANDAELKLAKLLPALKDRSGATYTFTSGATVANSYKFKRTATNVTLTRGATAWYLTNVKQVSIGKSAPAPVLALAEKQDKIAHENISRLYRVIK